MAERWTLDQAQTWTVWENEALVGKTRPGGDTTFKSLLFRTMYRDAAPLQRDVRALYRACAEGTVTAWGRYGRHSRLEAIPALEWAADRTPRGWHEITLDADEVRTALSASALPSRLAHGTSPAPAEIDQAGAAPVRRRPITPQIAKTLLDAYRAHCAASSINASKGGFEKYARAEGYAGGRDFLRNAFGPVSRGRSLKFAEK